MRVIPVRMDPTVRGTADFPDPVFAMRYVAVSREKAMSAIARICHSWGAKILQSSSIAMRIQRS